MKRQQALEQEEFLYQRVADRIEHQVRKGILKTGDKLLSVRALSREQGISISTVYQAYLQLEMKGLIEARPKSGYYVRFCFRKYPQITEARQPRGDSAKMSLDEMIAQVYQNLSDESILKFSLATPATELLPEAKLNKAMATAIRRSPDSCIQYEDIRGNLLLRKQIARHSFSWGGNLTEEDIVTTQGCLEALVICLRAITSPGDTVAVECPTYFSIFAVMKSLGLKALEIPADPVNGIDPDQLQRAIAKTKVKACLFVPNFNNPLGCRMSDANKQKLVQILAAREIPLIEDDIYGELYFGRTRPRTCKSFDREGWVLLCSSVSKTLAPGYRVGWCIPGRFKQQVLRLKLTSSVSSATPTQAAIGLFFENGRFDLHMRQLRKALHTQCLRYVQAISDYFPADTKLTQPEGGYVLWVEMNKGVNAFELFQKAIEYHISIAPGQLFSTDGRFGNFIRISFGKPYSRAIDESLQLLGKLAATL